MPLLESSSEEILPMAMLRPQQAQSEARPPTPLERTYDLLAKSQPLFVSRWTTLAPHVSSSSSPERM
jgi:hypothetical protein